MQVSGYRHHQLLRVSRYREPTSVTAGAAARRSPRCMMHDEMRGVIALRSLFGHHLDGEPAKWADSHLHDHDR
jgi:hypothetical protein